MMYPFRLQLDDVVLVTEGNKHLSGIKGTVKALEYSHSGTIAIITPLDKEKPTFRIKESQLVGAVP